MKGLKGIKCSCGRLWETKDEIRTAYFIRDRYVCQLCYQDAKIGRYDIRKRKINER